MVSHVLPSSPLDKATYPDNIPRQRATNHKGTIEQMQRGTLKKKGAYDKPEHEPTIKPLEIVDEHTGQVTKANGYFLPNGLTPKQEAFAQIVASGTTLTHAYRKAYNTGTMSEATVWTRACVMNKEPKVRDRILELQGEMNKNDPHDNERVRRVLREYLMGVVEDKRESTRDRSRAAELLGKVTGVGLFGKDEASAKENVVDNQAISDIKQALAKLARPNIGINLLKDKEK